MNSILDKWSKVTSPLKKISPRICHIVSQELLGFSVTTYLSEWEGHEGGSFADLQHISLLVSNQDGLFHFPSFLDMIVWSSHLSVKLAECYSSC